MAIDTLAKAGFRADIQALRGIAVLSVLGYHSGLGVLPAGYLGVDLFFVISGFLITGIIARGIDAKTFSFSGFYTRRVRRLLPAAYVVLFLTILASALILTSTQYTELLVNLAGALLFGANMTLWSQTGYFAPNSAFNPLLHFWSLAIEEQYYLLVPLALTVLPRRAWLGCLIASTVISLAACFYLATTRPSVAFFWLPPRAWELGVGSIASLVAGNDRLTSCARKLLIPAASGILIALVWKPPGPTPGFGAVMICSGTAVILLARHPRIEQFTPLRALARVGDFSYSLYLVHWPVLALARAPRLTTELPPGLSLALIVLSLVAGWLLYRFVEEPFRRPTVAGWKLASAVLASSALIAALGAAMATIRPNADPSGALTRPVEGLAGPACFHADPNRFDGRCSQSGEPAILVWGDSYAAHLIPGLDATTDLPIAQATKGHCSPFQNVAAVVQSNELSFSRDCLAFGRSVIDYVRRTPSVKVVVLSSQYSRFLSEASAFAIRQGDNKEVRVPLGLATLLAAQRETVAALRAAGRRVVVVSPPPPTDFDAGQCWLREAEHLPVTGAHAGCLLTRRNPARSAQRYDQMLSGFEQEAGVPVVRLDDALCAGIRCPISVEGRPIFRDDGHLTETGSLLVGRRLNLGQRVWSSAR